MGDFGMNKLRKSIKNKWIIVIVILLVVNFVGCKYFLNKDTKNKVIDYNLSDEYELKKFSDDNGDFEYVTSIDDYVFFMVVIFK